MGAFDTLISLTIVIVFISFVGAKIYSHEKEHIDPLIKKVKGWFVKEEEDFGPEEDFEIAFRGQVEYG